MHDQVRVSIGHRCAHLQEQIQALLQGSLARRAPSNEIFALHILHHHVGTAVSAYPSVIKPCDAWVIERRKDLTLCMKSAYGRTRSRTHELECNGLFELPVGASRAVNLAHATAAN